MIKPARVRVVVHRKALHDVHGGAKSQTKAAPHPSMISSDRPTRNQAYDHGDHRDDEQEMQEAAGDVKHGKTKQPADDQNHCQYP